jgi:hypothetical protein
MDWKKEGKILAAIIAVFLFVFYLPVGIPRFDNAVFEALHLVKWYAKDLNSTSILSTRTLRSQSLS